MDQKKLSKIQLFLGLGLVVAAGILMFLGVMPLTTRIVLGLVGIALIASARFGVRK